jgi:phenylalanyl-tRNA synthetase beta chain
MFIECTATDLTKANIVLNTMCSMFGEYCKDKFTVEPVEVVYANDYPANTFTKPGDKIVYPAMDPRPMDANVSRMKQSLGLDHLKADEVKDLLTKMSIVSEVDKKDKNILHCDIPITRSDIMHECDLIEDLAIAYGYMNLEQKIPQTLNWPAEQPVNHLTDLLRVEVAMAGFNECLNWGLISNNENFGFLRRVENKAELWRTAAQPHEYIPGAPAVEISNPKTAGFEVVRSSLLPGLLKTLAANKHNAPPIKLFEIGDAVVQEPSRETGSKNQRRVVALTAGMSADFKVIHGLLDQLMWKLDVEPVYARKADSKKRFFKLEPSEDETFMKGFQASIVIEDIVIGRIGVLHPEVVKAFEVPMPTSALEFNLEPFLEWL